MGRAAGVLHRRLVRLHAVAAVAGQPGRRPAAHPRVAGRTTPRSPPRRPTATRPHRSGSARSCSSPTRRATATSFRAVRNEDYWRGPNGITGEDLPYLDAIEAVVAVDIESRANGLRSGQFDSIHTVERRHDQPVPRRRRARDDRDQPLRRHRLHHAQRRRRRRGRPRGHERREPAAQRALPRAIAHATDSQRLADERGAGLVQAGQRPVPARLDRLPRGHRLPGVRPGRRPERDGHCLSELGTDSIEFTFNTTNDPFNVETNTLVISMWTGGLRRQGQGHDHADRAGPVHRPRARRSVQAPGVAQPQRHRSRPAAAVVAQRVGPRRSAAWR